MTIPARRLVGTFRGYQLKLDLACRTDASHAVHEETGLTRKHNFDAEPGRRCARF